MPLPPQDTAGQPCIDTDALVIGAGPAGLFQVFQLGLQGIRCHVVDALPYVGGQCAQLYGDKPIYDIPGIPLCTGRELVQLLQRQIAPLDARFHPGQQVMELKRLDDGRWHAVTTAGQQFQARSVFIAAGVGAFVPKALKVEGMERLAPGQLHYHPSDLSMLDGKITVVHGGDEDAVAAAIASAGKASATYLLYRRDAFQADAALLDRLQALRNSGAIRVVIGQITALHATEDGQLRAVQWMDGEGLEHELPAQQLVACLGISPRLGPVTEWGLAMERKHLNVDPATQATDAPGIYAVGDIVTYPGKRKLILCGFHEATMAAFAAAEYLQGEKPLLQYTTTSARLHAILGVSHPQA